MLKPKGIVKLPCGASPCAPQPAEPDLERTLKQPRSIVDCANTLGEGVRWDASDQSLWWTDIEARTLFRAREDGRELRHWTLPKRLASFAPTNVPETLLCAFDDELSLWHYPTASGRTLYRLDAPGQRFNDGRAAPDGSFVVGTMAETTSADAGGLYQVARYGSVRTLFEPIRISNSICFSPDGKTMYFSDSAAGLIWRCDFPLRAPLQPQEHIRLIEGEPDGAVTDAAGNLWVAVWGTGTVHCYTPDGQCLQVIALDARQPSCVAFGGPDLDTLFITTARTGLTLPGATDGDLFATATETRGREESPYVVT